MSNQAQIKIHESEKAILKLEEEALLKLISQYQGAMNALKVEELTLTNRLGKSQDIARLSQSRSISTASSPSLNLKLPLIGSSSPSIYSNFKPKHINEQTLNLGSSPLNIMKGNDEEEEEEEYESE